MKVAFLLLTLFTSFKVFSQDSLLRQRSDTVIHFIESSGFSRVVIDTIGFWGSTDGNTVKGYYKNTFYYDSLNQLKKVVAEMPFRKTQTVHFNGSKKAFYFEDNLLLKALVFRDDTDSVAYNNYVVKRQPANKGRDSLRSIANVETGIFYYSSYDNWLDESTIQKLIVNHPDQKKFLRNLSIGIEFIKQNQTKSNLLINNLLPRSSKG